MDDGYVDEIEEQADDSRPEERDLAEDAQWKKIQKNTFTRWTNQHLKVQGSQINDLQYDLSDGLKLVSLIQVLSSQQFKHVNKRPTFRTQKLENVTMVMKFLEESEQLRLVNIDSSDIVDCRLKLILGLIWTLILHYSISMPLWEGEEPIAKDAKGKGPSPKQRILAWLNTKMPDKPVKNLTTDWNNGIAIGALVDALAPGLCPDWSDWNPKDALKNAKEAMDLAEKWLDVAQLLKPEEMVDPRIDEKALMTYLSQIPNAKLKDGAPLRPKTNPARVRAYGPGLEKTGNAINAPARFTVDAFSAGAGKLEVLILNPKGANETCTVELKPNQTQIYACCYTPTMQGEYRVIIKYAGKEIPNSPFQVTVEGTAGDPSKVTASGPGIELKGNIMGKRTFFNVFLNNAGLGNIECKIKDPQNREEIIKPLITKQTETNFLVEYTPILGGLHTVSVMFAGRPIPLSPFSVEVASDSGKKSHPLESHPIMQGNGIKPGGIVPESTPALNTAPKKTEDNISLKPNKEAVYVTGRGIQPKGLRVNEPTEFIVHTEKAGPGKVQAKVVGPGGINETVKITPKNDGTYFCEYKPTKIGQYVVIVEFGTGQVPKSPFKVDVAGVSKSKIIAYGPGLKSGVVNSPAPFTVECHGSPGELGFAIEGPSEAKITCTDNGDGSAAVQYVPLLPGEYAVHVTCNKEDIKDSPFMAQISDVPGVKFDATKVKAFGPGLQPKGVQANKETNFTIDIKNSGGPVEVKTWCIDVNGMDVPIKMTNMGNSTYTCTYTTKTVGKHTIYITYGGIEIPGSPYKIDVSGESSVGNVIASGSGLESATIGKPATFIIDARPVGGDTGPITVDILTEDKKKIPFQSKDKDGIREIQYTPVGTFQTKYTIQISYKNKPINNSPFTVPINTTSSTGVAYVTGRGIQPKGIRVNEEVSFSVHTENAPANGTVKAKLIGPGGVQGTINITKESEKVFKCNYKPLKVGNYVITVDYANAPVTGSPFKVQVDAESQSKIKAYGPGLEKCIVGVPAPFTVESNNENTQLGFAINGPSEAKIDCHDNGDGSVSVVYHPTKPGEHAIHITANDQDIPKSPYMVMATENTQPIVDTSKIKVFGPGIEPNGNVSEKQTSFTVDAKAYKDKKPVEVKCFDSDGAIVPVKITENPDFTYTCTYTPILPKKHTIYVSYAGIEVPNSPYKVNVGQGKTGSIKTSGPGLEKAISGQPTYFIVDTTEVGSQTSALFVDIKMSKGQQVPFNSKVTKPGICEISYTPVNKVEDTVIITLNYQSEPVKGSPFKVNCSGSVSEPSSGRVYVTGKGVLPKGIKTNELVSFKVHTEKPTSNDNLKTKVVGPNGVPLSVQTKRLTPDTYECQYSSPTEGNHVITVDFNGKSVEKSPFKVLIAPQKPSNIKAYGPGLEGGVVDKPAVFTVNPHGETTQLDFKIEGPREAKITCKDNGDGTIGVQYLPLEKGEYSVHVLSNNEDIPLSPFIVDIENAPDNSVHPEKVKVYGPGVQTPGVVQGKPTQFTVDATQAGPIKPLLVKCYDTDGAIVPIQTTNVSNQVTTNSYNPIKPGKHLISVAYGGVQVPNSPFTVNVGAQTGNEVVAYGAGLTNAEMNTPTSFIVDATGVNGITNKIQHSIVDDKNQKLPTKATEIAPGKQEISYTPSKPGIANMTVNVSYDGKPIKGSPFKVPVQPKKDKNVKITGRGVQPVGLRVAEEVSFNVESDSPIAIKDLKPKIVGPGGVQDKATVTQVTPNKLQCTYVPSKIGNYSIIADLDGKPIDKSPYKVDIAPKTDSPIRAFGSGLENGQANSPATFFVETNGETGQIGFEVKGPSEAKLSCVDEGNGRVKVDYLPELPGEYNVRVLCNNSDIQNSPFMVPISPAILDKCDLTKAKAFGPGIESAVLPADKETTFTVDTRECGPVLPAVAKCYDKQGTPIPIKSSKQPNGVETFTYTPKSNGDHVVQVSVDNKEIPKSPFKLNVENARLMDSKKPTDGILVYGPGLKNTEINSNAPVNFYVDCRLCDNPSSCVPKVEIFDDKKKLISAEVKSTNTPDLYEVTYQLKDCAASECLYPKVTIEGENIPGSPFTVPLIKNKDSKYCGTLENLKKNVKPHQPHTFMVNLNEGTKSEPSVILTDNDGVPLAPVQLQKLSPNVFQATYTPTDIGQCVITATADGKLVEGTPVNISVVENPENVEKIKIEGLAPMVEACNPQTFKVLTPDNSINPDLINVQVLNPENKIIPIHKETIPEGTKITYVPEENGPHAVGCWVQDQPLNESPCIVKSLPKADIHDAIQKKSSQGTLTVDEKDTLVGKPCSFLIENNEIKEGIDNVDVLVLSPDKHNHVPVKTKLLPEGLCCEFVPEIAGPYSLMASIDNSPIKGSPKTIVVQDKKPITEEVILVNETKSLKTGNPHNPLKKVNPGKSNKPYTALEEAIKEMKDTAVESSKWPQSKNDQPSSKVLVYGEGLENVVANEKATFTIDSKEAPSAPIGVTVEGPGEAIIDCVDNGDGTCGVVYEVPTSGLYTINVLYDNVHIPQSPIVVPVYPKDNRNIDLSSITASGSGLNPEGVFKDCFAKFTVDASEITPTGEGVVKVLVQSPSGKKTSGVVDNLHNGKYTVRYTPTEEGPHKLSVTYEGLPVQESPFIIPAKPGFNAKLVTANGPGLNYCKVNEKTQFIVDLDGAGHGSLGLSIEGPADAEIQCHDNKDGTCLVEYTPVKSGEYDINVKFNDEDISDSPFHVQVLDEVKPEKVKCSGPVKEAKQSRPNHFTVDCSEAGKAPLQATIVQPESGKPEKPATYKQVDGALPGVFDVCYVPDALGPCLIDVKYDNIKIPGSPFKVNVVQPAQVDKVKVVGDGIVPPNGTILASMPAVFHVDTKDAGVNPDVNVGLFNPNGEPMPLHIEARPNGLYTCEYQTHDVGDHKISVDVDGAPLPKSPYTVKSVPTGNAEKCNIKDGKEKAIQVNKESVIKIETKEAGKGQITCTVKKIERQKVGQVEQLKVLDSIKVEVEEHPDGITSVHYVPKEEGEYLVEVKFGGQTIPNGKFIQTATYSFQEVRETTTRSLQSQVSSQVATNAFHGVNFEINTKDTNPGNLNAKVVRPSGSIEEVPIKSDDNYKHNIKVAYQPSERGPHQLQLNSEGRPIKGSPFQFFVDTKGEGRVTAYGPGLSSGTTNEVAEFTVITKDAGPGGLSLIVEGPSKTEIKCEDNHDGTFKVSYVPQAPGNYNIIIKFKDQPIAGSPFIATISGEPIKKSQVAVGNSSEIPLKIPTSDISTLTAELTTPSKKKIPCVIKKMNNGALGVSFTPKETGEHLVNVYEKGTDIPGSPFKINVKNEEVGDASKVKVSGKGLEKGLANQVNEFTIDTRDAGYGSLNISIEGPSKAEIDCKDNENGTCSVKYLPTEPGTYVINVTYAGVNVSGSPFTVNVEGDRIVPCETQKMEHVQEAAKATKVGGNCEINLKMDDMALKDLKVNVHTPSGFTEPCDIEDVGNGNMRLKFIARESGVHHVSVLYKDRHIRGSPFQFTVGSVSQGGSKDVTASGPGLERGFLDLDNEFAIYTREAGAGNISVAMEGPSKAEMKFQESQDKGSCTVTYRVSQPGDYECSIKFNGEHIVNSPFHIHVEDDTVKPNAARAVSSSFTDKTTEKDVGGLISITVRAEDGEIPKLEASVQTPSGNMEPAIVQQIGDGQYGVKFTPRESGTHMVFVENNKKPINGSPFRIPVGHYNADPGMVHATGEGLSRAVVDKKAHFFVNTTNAGSGSLNVAIDGPSKVNMNCHETEEGYEFTYVATAPGNYIINITYGGNFHIVGSPFTAVCEGTKTGDTEVEQHSQVEIEASDKRCVSQYAEKTTSYAEKVICQGLGLKQARLNSVNSFFVDASQAGYGILLVGIAGPVRPCEEVVVRHVGNNQFTVDYVVKESGTHIIMVRWGDKDIPGSPFMVHVD